MSYILDALKKADAERERGAVPGLHSQPLGQVEDDDDDDGGGGARKAMPPVVWLGAGVGLCLIAVLSWQLLASKKDEAAAVVSAPMAEEQQPADHAPMQRSQDMQAQPPQATQQQQQPFTPPPREMQPPRPARSLNEGQRPIRDTREAPPAPRGNAGKTNDGGSTGNASSPRATAGERIPTANELPDDVRHTLPQLTIGGAMYSDTPSSRMLIINSQVFHEGDQPYQGLVLEEIKLKSAVFRYRGYRYAINY